MNSASACFEVPDAGPENPAVKGKQVKSGIRSDIQGLRGIAVGAVVVEHAFPKILPGGYVGVDIFFVISGFLISGIVARDIDHARFSIVDFYRRRIRRIFPALMVMIVTTFLAGALILSPTAFRELGTTAVYTLAFVSNFIFAQMGGYFGGDAHLKPLLHMWSLAVEEQFYIFFPPFMILFWKRLGRQKTLHLIMAAFMLSLLCAEVMRHYYSDAAYYMLPPRAFEILLGVVFGLGGVPPLRTAAKRGAASVLGITMILAACFLFTPDTAMPSIAALLPCGGAILIIHAGSSHPASMGRGTMGGRLISNPPLVFIGAISYSLYLWHWPVLALMRSVLGLELPVIWGGAAVVLAVLLASASYYAVEQPFLAPKARTWPIFKLGAGVAALCAALCLVVVVGQGLPQRFSPKVQKLFAASGDYNPRRRTCHYDGGTKLIPYRDACLFGASGVQPDVAVWGDSHGAELSVYLGEQAARQGRSVKELTSSACPPSIGFALGKRPLCPRINAQTVSALAEDSAIKTVVMTINASAYPNTAKLRVGLQQSVAQLTAAGKDVILVKQIPIMPFDPPAKIGIWGAYHAQIDGVGMQWTNSEEESEEIPVSIAEQSAYDSWLNRQVPSRVESGAAAGEVYIYDPKQALCRLGRCYVYRSDVGLLYFNRNHLSLTGVRVAFASLADRLYSSAQSK